MEKIFKFSIIAVFLLFAWSAVNYSYAEREGYEMDKVPCFYNPEIEVDICRPNTIAKCDVSAQELCPQPRSSYYSVL